MGDRFRTTQWTLVRAAGDSANPDSRAALQSLCAQYWSPVYVFVRRKGQDAEAARDLTQGFFAHLLQSHALGKVDPERGRFRSFLMESVTRFVRDEWRKDNAQKRGAGEVPLSLDVEGTEDWYAAIPRDRDTPETVFDRRWAASVLDRALVRIGSRMEEAGQGERFLALRPFLTGEGTGSAYGELAETLSMSDGAVKTAVHRLRRDFGGALREEVAQTLLDPKMIDDEIRVLREALAHG